MTLSHSLSAPNPSPLSANLLRPKHNFSQFSFTSKTQDFLFHQRFLSGDRILQFEHGKAERSLGSSSFGNPSMTIEKDKYTYYVEKLINKLSSLTSPGSIAWSNDAYNLLDEMITTRVSDIHQVIGQMIKGDYDGDSNWQSLEYVFDKLNSEGCGLGTRFCNTLLESLWWMGQKERAARVLNEA